MRRCWLVLAAVLFLGSCALAQTVRELPFAIPAPEARAKMPGAESVAVKVSVSDQRVDKTRIGTTTANMFGSRGARSIVTSKEPVPDVLDRAVRAELEARGYALAEGPAFLLFDILSLDYNSNSVDRVAEYVIEMEFDVKVMDAAGNRLHGDVFTRRESGSWRVSTDSTSRPPSVPKVAAELIAEAVGNPQLSAALFKANGL